MKRFFTYIALLAVAAVSITSCQQEKIVVDKYVPATVTGAQYYFPSALSTSYTIKPSTTGFDFTVMRGGSVDAAGSVQVAVKDTSKTIFASGNGTLTAEFAVNEKETTVTLPIDYSKYNYGDLYGLDLEITSETSLYAPFAVHIEISLPEPWKSLGKGLYREGFVSPWYGIDALEYEVEVLENELYPGYYRMVNPYGAAYGYNEPGDYDTDKDYYMDIHAEDPEGVWIPYEKSNMHWSDGYFTMGSLGGYYIQNNLKTLEEVKAAGYAGVLKDGIITFPGENNRFVIEEENYNGGNPKTIKSANFRLVMPGVKLKDYSIAAEYTGLLSKADGDYALIDVTLGADVEKAVLAIVPGDDPEEAYYQIFPELRPKTTQEEEEESDLVEITASGEVRVLLRESADAYSYVVVSYADEDYQDMAYETFAYKDFSISLVADKPELGSDMKSGSVKATVTMGKDVEYGEIALFEGVPEEKDLAVFGTDAVKKVHYSGEEFIFDLPATGKYTILAVSYAEEKDWNLAAASFELTGLTFVLDEDFEVEGDELPEGWTSVDADGDGMEWFKLYNYGYRAHSGKGVVVSFSWYNAALQPNDWLFSPAVEFTKDNYLSFWVSADDPGYYQEHYAVYLLTSPEASDTAEPLMEDTLWFTSASAYNYLAGYEEWQNNKGQTGYYMHFVIPIPESFADKTGYIAFRHFDCSDYYTIDIDDVQVSEGNPVPEEDPLKVSLKAKSKNASWIIPVSNGKTRDAAPVMKKFVSVQKGQRVAAMGLSKGVKNSAK